MPLDSPAPRLHINTHTWNWKVSSHLPEAEERRKEWSWQWCRKVRELKVNFPRNRKYPSNTGTHTHTHTQTYSKWQRTATSFCTQYQKKKKKKPFLEKRFCLILTRMVNNMNFVKKEIQKLPFMGTLPVLKHVPPTYRILWNSCNNSGLWEAWAYPSFTERNQISEQLEFARGHPVTMTLSHDESTFVWLLIS